MKSVKLNELLVIVFDFNDLNSGKLYETMENIYEEIDDHNLFILDLSNIRHLSDEAAGSLIYIQSYLKDRKKSVRMYQTKDQIHNVYEKLNLENVMSVAYNTGENETENMIFYIN
jgi:anti-anti-sigma regulatory factor